MFEKEKKRKEIEKRKKPKTKTQEPNTTAHLFLFTSPANLGPAFSPRPVSLHASTGQRPFPWAQPRPPSLTLASAQPSAPADPAWPAA